jgi:hypothetical protein
LWVPKRLRWYLEREPRAVSAVLPILLRVIEAHLRRGSGTSAHAQLGAVSFIHRFGASLNGHIHYHGCVIDGVFAPDSPLREVATAYGRDAAGDPSASAEVAALPADPAPNTRSPARYLWAMLLARLFESLPLTCPNCRADIRIIAVTTDAVPVERILSYIG